MCAYFEAVAPKSILVAIIMIVVQTYIFLTISNGASWGIYCSGIVGSSLILSLTGWLLWTRWKNRRIKTIGPNLFTGAALQNAFHWPQGFPGCPYLPPPMNEIKKEISLPSEGYATLGSNNGNLGNESTILPQADKPLLFDDTKKVLPWRSRADTYAAPASSSEQTFDQHRRQSLRYPRREVQTPPAVRAISDTAVRIQPESLSNFCFSQGSVLSQNIPRSQTPSLRCSIETILKSATPRDEFPSYPIDYPLLGEYHRGNNESILAPDITSENLSRFTSNTSLTISKLNLGLSSQSLESGKKSSNGSLEIQSEKALENINTSKTSLSKEDGNKKRSNEGSKPRPPLIKRDSLARILTSFTSSSKKTSSSSNVHPKKKLVKQQTLPALLIAKPKPLPSLGFILECPIDIVPNEIESTRNQPKIAINNTPLTNYLYSENGNMQKSMENRNFPTRKESPVSPKLFSARGRGRSQSLVHPRKRLMRQQSLPTSEFILDCPIDFYPSSKTPLETLMERPSEKQMSPIKSELRSKNPDIKNDISRSKSETDVNIQNPDNKENHCPQINSSFILKSPSKSPASSPHKSSLSSLQELPENCPFPTLKDEILPAEDIPLKTFTLQASPPVIITQYCSRCKSDSHLNISTDKEETDKIPSRNVSSAPKIHIHSNPIIDGQFSFEMRVDSLDMGKANAQIIEPVVTGFSDNEVSLKDSPPSYEEACKNQSADANN